MILDGAGDMQLIRIAVGDSDESTPDRFFVLLAKHESEWHVLFAMPSRLGRFYGTQLIELLNGRQ